MATGIEHVAPCTQLADHQRPLLVIVKCRFDMYTASDRAGVHVMCDVLMLCWEESLKARIAGVHREVVSLPFRTARLSRDQERLVDEVVMFDHDAVFGEDDPGNDNYVADEAAAEGELDAMFGELLSDDRVSDAALNGLATGLDHATTVEDMDEAMDLMIEVVSVGADALATDADKTRLVKEVWDG